MTEKFGLIINGERVITNDYFEIKNPFNNSVVGYAPIASDNQIFEALENSFKYSCKLGAVERTSILKKTVELLKDNRDELSMLIAKESGLCLKDTNYEVGRAINVATFSSYVAEVIEQDITPDFLFGSQKDLPKLSVISEPLDLVVGITPFNHPLNQVAHKVFPAIAAGTPIVLKPSEKTPLSAIKLAELLLDAGLPANMLNVITSNFPEKIVPKMLGYSNLDMVTFTGGLHAGVLIKKLMVDNGNALKKYVPELGGSSSVIVASDADLDKAVEVILNGCFKNSGQRCTAIRRVIVLNSVVNDLVNKLEGEVAKIKYGDPFDLNMDIGTVISEESAMLIEERVNKAVNDGADLLYGNIRKGALYSPTLLDNVSIDSALVSKETFGPVCPIIRVDDIAQAIYYAKKTNYCLAGAVVTRRRDLALKVADSLKVGQFSWNGVPGYRTEVAPFGGFNDSGNGEKEGVLLAAKGMRRIRTFYEH